MATTAFVSSGLEFVPNNYTAPLNTANAPEAFHIIQEFLAQSAIGRALVEPEKLSGLQIKAFWESGVYDNGGATGTPSIIFEFEESEYVITPGTVRQAMGFPEYSSYTTGMGESDLLRMMREIGYSGPLNKIGQLKRPFLRKEWSFFFDCITRTFGKKCTNWDAIPTDSLQIGYSLLFDNHFDLARLVLNNLGEKMTENRGVVYFSRFCQILFSYCVKGVTVVNEDVSCFKLHKRVFSDLINKDIKKGIDGDLLLPASVQQFVDAQVNPQPQAESRPDPLDLTVPSSSTVTPARGGRTKHLGTKPAKRSSTATGVSRTEEMPQTTRIKKRRANKAQSVDEPSETEADEETLHQRKRRLVAAQLFGDIIATLDKVPEETETPEAFVQEDAANPEAVNQERIQTEDPLIEMDFDREAPTSNANDVVEEAAVHSASRTVDHEDTIMETDQATTGLLETLASHTEIITIDFEKGEEVDQVRVDQVEEAVAVPADATENVHVAAEFVANSENVIVLEAQQQSVVENVQKEAEVLAKVNSEIPEAVAEKVNDEAAQLQNEITAEHVPEEIPREDENVEASPVHSNPDIQVELSQNQANSEEAREVYRAANEFYKDMYFSDWSNKNTIFSNERAADFVKESSKEIKNPELLSHLKATVVQIKSLNNRFDDSDKVIEGLRNDIATREHTMQKDKSLYISLCKEQKTFNSRLLKVEENQIAMSTQLTSISNALELLTSVLLSDDVKKGESVPKDKCKDTQALRRKDDSTDGGSKGNERRISAQSQRRVINSGGQSTSGLNKSLVVSTNPSLTDEEIAAKIFIKEHGKDVTIEDIRAEEQILAEEHKKKIEAGIYKKKSIKAPRKKETGISIKENTQQSIQYTRRPVIRNSDKGKGIMIEEPNLKKKDNSTSEIAQVGTRSVKSPLTLLKLIVLLKL